MPSIPASHAALATRTGIDQHERKRVPGLRGERRTIFEFATTGRGVLKHFAIDMHHDLMTLSTAKMLVHRRARRGGVGEALLVAAERCACSAGKTLLVLDTVTDSDASRLYARNGWQRCGEIPNYALWPDGRPCATTVYFKSLR